MYCARLCPVLNSDGRHRCVTWGKCLMRLVISYFVFVYTYLIGLFIWHGVNFLNPNWVSMSRILTSLFIFPVYVLWVLGASPGLWWEGSISLTRMIRSYVIILGVWAAIYGVLYCLIWRRCDGRSERHWTG